MPEKYMVIDTNVIVSAALSSSSVPGRCLNKALLVGSMVYSNDTLQEYSTILLSNKFDKYLSLVYRENFLNKLISGSRLVIIKNEIEACRDPKDDKYLELAVACNASCIVSGDKDLLVMDPFRGIPILRPGDFLEKF